MIKTTLYKIDQKGKLRFWSIDYYFDNEDFFCYIMEIKYGAYGGNSTKTIERITEGKGGRDDTEQVVSRVNSRINEKLDSGYVRTREEALSMPRNLNALKTKKPMLAQPFEKAAKGFVMDDAIVQYKLDGNRCLVTKRDGELIAYSRNGKIIDTIDHILEGIDIPEGVTIDGELYHHGTPLQTICSWIKRKQPNTAKLSYNVYDVISKHSYKYRLEQLRLMNFGENAFLVECFEDIEQGDIQVLFRQAREKGYEGLIVRLDGYQYEAGKRSKGLLKVKECMDDEFLIIDILASKDNWARFVCLMPNGKTFRVTAHGTIEEKTRILEQKGDYIGKKVRVEYAGYTNEGKPFHPVALYFRDKDDE